MYEKPIEMSRNDDYTTVISHYLYYKYYYKLLGIDSSGQVNTSISQQINFTGK